MRMSIESRAKASPATGMSVSRLRALFIVKEVSSPEILKGDEYSVGQWTLKTNTGFQSFRRLELVTPAAVTRVTVTRTPPCRDTDPTVPGHGR